MRLLLDSHALLWFLQGDARLPVAQRQTIENLEHPAFVSIVSLWEISIKTSLGKLRLSEPFGEFFDRELDQNAFEILPVSYAHILRLTTLPPHHRDPFDRMLVAQALQDDLVLISADGQLDAYGIERSWG